MKNKFCILFTLYSFFGFAQQKSQLLIIKPTVFAINKIFTPFVIFNDSNSLKYLAYEYKNKHVVSHVIKSSFLIKDTIRINRIDSIIANVFAQSLNLNQIQKNQKPILQICRYQNNFKKYYIEIYDSKISSFLIRKLIVSLERLKEDKYLISVLEDLLNNYLFLYD
jgi:hypothetical protein